MGSKTKKGGLAFTTLLNPQLGQGIRKYQQNNKKSKVARARRDKEWQSRLDEAEGQLEDQDALKDELSAEQATLSPEELEATRGMRESKRKIKKSILSDRSAHDKSLLG